MKKSTPIFGVLVIFIITLLIISVSPLTGKDNVGVIQRDILRSEADGKQLVFTKNIGQWDDEVLYKSTSGDMTLWFTKSGVWYQINRVRKIEESSINDNFINQFKKNAGKPEYIMIKTDFEGANRNLDIRSERSVHYKTNYFLGNDKNRWKTDVPNFEEIIYENIYQGIDLRYFSNGSELEYDFIVAPGADPSKIQIKYEGINSLKINEKHELEIETQFGIITEKHPLVYQGDNENRIECNYSEIKENTFGFDLLKTYDKTRPLIIDPAIEYSRFLGGSSNESANSFKIDNYLSIFITGQTNSTDFPLNNEYQSIHAGNWDVFVTKLSADGKSILYSTYIGGSGDDIARDIDAVNYYAFVTGQTNSVDFPTINAQVSDALDNEFGWEAPDCFALRLNAFGDNLDYSTYIGGVDEDYATSIAVTDDYKAYIVGWAYSDDFPLQNALDATFSLGEAFVACLTTGGINFITYLGGSSSEIAIDVSLDADDNPIITGSTMSSNFPIRSAYQSSFSGGNSDAFLTKLKADGSDYIFSTFLGGGNHPTGNGPAEMGAAIATNAGGDIYLLGHTPADDFPTVNAYQNVYGGGEFDIFLAKFNSNGTSPEFITFLGGSGKDIGSGICLNSADDIILSGATTSGDFPIFNEMQSSLAGGNDGIIAKFNNDGSSLLYSTYIGGTNDDYFTNIDLCDDNYYFVVGYSESADFPRVGYSGYLHGTQDIVLLKIDDYICIDYDGDGFGNADQTENECPADNCDYFYNPDQLDSNSDGIGDACTFSSTTPAGVDVQTDLSWVSLVFDEVTLEGNTELMMSSAGTEPSSFELSPSLPPIYYDITSDAVFTGYVEVCIPYDGDGLTLEEEESMQIMHYDGYSWVDITSSVNTIDDIVCGLTTSLSPFVAGRQITFVCGDVDGTPGINILDIVYLINFRYKSGPPPAEPGAADVNSDGSVNILDIVYLINFIYKGGPNPSCT